MGLLGSVEGRLLGEGRRKGGGGKIIERWKVEKAIRRIKCGKAAGKNKVENEVWKFGGEGIKGAVEEMCNMVWNGAGWPEGWKMGIIVGLYF